MKFKTIIYFAILTLIETILLGIILTILWSHFDHVVADESNLSREDSILFDTIMFLPPIITALAFGGIAIKLKVSPLLVVGIGIVLSILLHRFLRLGEFGFGEALYLWVQPIIGIFTVFILKIAIHFSVLLSDHKKKRLSIPHHE